MSNSIDTAFIKQYEAEVKEAYQREGSLLRNLVRTRTNVKGESTRFQKIGTGTATQKDTNGLITPMNLSHAYVDVTLSDFYAGDYVDKLDLLKTNIDERQLAGQAGARALGRKTDEVLYAAMQTLGSGSDIAHGSAGMSLTKFYAAKSLLQSRNVDIRPGDVTLILPPKEFNRFKQINQVSSSDFVDKKVLNGAEGFQFDNVLIMSYSGTAIASNIAECFMFHKLSMAQAFGMDVTTDITWHGDRAAWFISNMVSTGAGLIDSDGIVRIFNDINAA